MIKIDSLRRLIKESILSEIDIEDIGDVCFATGSTHVMKTCSIGNDKFFLKFSDETLFEDTDPSLQILVEYLAYKIYELFPNVRIPRAQLVYDKTKKVVGIATSAVNGKMSGTVNINPQKFASMMSAGVYVDIFLANWDVIGTGTGNVIIDKDVATRIDPGGSLTFRAQGGRKGAKFGKTAGELKTMLDPSFGGSGRVFQHADLVSAGKTFSSVSWSEIADAIQNAKNEVLSELQRHNMTQLASEWEREASEIATILKARHAEVMEHVKFAAKS